MREKHKVLGRVWQSLFKVCSNKEDQKFKTEFEPWDPYGRNKGPIAARCHLPSLPPHIHTHEL